MENTKLFVKRSSTLNLPSLFDDVNDQHLVSAIIVPTRDRDEQWDIFTEHFCSFWTFNSTPLHIWRVEQAPLKSFNRAWLFNVGFKLHTSGNDTDSSSCICIHDVDLLPDPGVDYLSCSSPTQISSELEHYNWGIPYPTSVGGVLLASQDHWRRVNCMSNQFWGWGGEDDELYYRLKKMGLLMQDNLPRRPARGKGRFRKNSVSHNRKKNIDKEYNQNLALLRGMQDGSLDPFNDGLNQVEFVLQGSIQSLNLECNPLVTIHSVVVSFKE